MLQLSTPCLKVSRDVLSNNGCGRLLHILILSRKKECLYVEGLAYATRNRAMDDVVSSSSGGIVTGSFTILYIITALHLVLLSAISCHCSVFNIDVTLLVCR